MGVQAEVLQQLIARTTIPNTLSNRVGNCKRTPMPPPGPWYPEYPPESGLIMPYGPGVAPSPPEAGIAAPPPTPGIGVVPPSPPTQTGEIPPPGPAPARTGAGPLGQPTSAAPPPPPPTTPPAGPPVGEPTTAPLGIPTAVVTTLLPRGTSIPGIGTATSFIGSGTKTGFAPGAQTGPTATGVVSKVVTSIFIPSDPSKPSENRTAIYTNIATGMNMPTGFQTVPVPTATFTGTKVPTTEGNHRRGHRR